MYPIKEIPVAEVVVRDTAIRKVDPKSEKYQSLREDFRRGNAQLSPILVTEEHDEETDTDQFSLVEGRHRLTAFQELGKETIIALIIPPGLSEAEIMGIQLRANALRITQTPSQEGEQYKRMLNSDPDLTVDQIAQISGKTVNEIRGRLKITKEKLGEKTATLVDSGAINLQNARTLATLDPALHDDDTLHAAQVMKPKEFQEHVHAIKTSIRAGEDPKKKAASKEFEVKPKFRDKDTLVSEIESGKLAQAKFDNPGEQEAFLEGIRFALSIDDDTLSEAREKFELQKQEAERIKIEKDIEKAKKKQEELEKQAAEVQKLREETN